ncbi:hypothetical protein CK203_001986 [Vitis vinifera]|uniref:Uncharacterized protein n=1 Tax=Vitis vinifera TaxID=29760 RepID=A0A438KJL8_VITVI|nr:hypothetical protein CK203_001986 [Vitis vinifera]
MAPKKTVSSVRVSEAGEKAIDKLNAKEFRERFRIPHDVLIDLVNEEAAILLRKVEKTLSSSQRNNSTRGSGSLCQPCSRNSSTSLRFHPSSFIPTCPGADGMQHYQHAVQPRPYATGINCQIRQREGEGAGGSLGWMGGAIAASVEAFFSELYLKNPGFGMRGHLVDWVERRPLPAAWGALYCEGAPLYQEAKEADAERRRKLLEDKIRKKLKALSGRLPDRSGVRTSPKKLQEKGEDGEEAWEGHEGTHSSQGVSSSPNYL